jgi:hypothetical protein
MIYHKRLAKKPKTFRRLTGLSVEKFDELLQELTVRWQRQNAKRLLERKRKRAPRLGNQFSLCLGDRLLMLVIYYRTYVTHSFLEFLFHLDESNVGRNIRLLEPILQQIFKIPEKKIEMSKDEIQELFFDGTEQRINRPKKKQKRCYSGKKKHHTIKHQVVVAKVKKPKGRGRKKRKLRIKSVSKSFFGTVHDKKIYDQAGANAPPGVPEYGDSGYRGIDDMILPKRKPKKKSLKAWQKRYNRRHSGKRVCVEHAIGHMKIFKILSHQYRNSLKRHTLIFKNIAGLHNLMFA